MLCRLHCVGQYLEFRACCYTTILTLSRDSASEMHLHVEALYKCPVIIIINHTTQHLVPRYKYNHHTSYCNGILICASSRNE